MEDTILERKEFAVPYPNLDILEESLNKLAPLASLLPLRLKSKMHATICHATEQAVSLVLNLGHGTLDDHGLNPLFPEGGLKLFEDSLSLTRRPCALHPLPPSLG